MYFGFQKVEARESGVRLLSKSIVIVLYLVYNLKNHCNNKKDKSLCEQDLLMILSDSKTTWKGDLKAERYFPDIFPIQFKIGSPGNSNTKIVFFVVFFCQLLTFTGKSATSSFTAITFLAVEAVPYAMHHILYKWENTGCDIQVNKLCAIDRTRVLGNCFGFGMWTQCTQVTYSSNSSL